jgi:hypothetical protein
MRLIGLVFGGDTIALFALIGVAELHSGSWSILLLHAP